MGKYLILCDVGRSINQLVTKTVIKAFNFAVGNCKIRHPCNAVYIYVKYRLRGIAVQYRLLKPNGSIVKKGIRSK